jgi:hypothetical protein
MNPTHLAMTAATNLPLATVEQRVQDNDEKIQELDLVAAFKLGRAYQNLEDEKIQLTAEVTILRRDLQNLQIVHQAEWSAVLENIKIKIHVLADKVQALIDKLELFKTSQKDKLDYLDKIKDKDTSVSSFIAFKMAYPNLGFEDLHDVGGACKAVDDYIPLLKLIHRKLVSFEPDISLRVHLLYKKDPISQATMSSQKQITIEGKGLQKLENQIAALKEEVTAIRENNTSLLNQSERLKKKHARYMGSLKNVTDLKTIASIIKDFKVLVEDIDINVDKMKVTRVYRKLSNLFSSGTIPDSYIPILVGYERQGLLIKEQVTTLVKDFEESTKEFRRGAK